MKGLAFLSKWYAKVKGWILGRSHPEYPPGIPRRDTVP